MCAYTQIKIKIMATLNKVFLKGKIFKDEIKSKEEKDLKENLKNFLKIFLKIFVPKNEPSKKQIK